METLRLGEREVQGLESAEREADQGWETAALILDHVDETAQIVAKVVPGGGIVRAPSRAAGTPSIEGEDLKSPRRQERPKAQIGQ